MNNKALNLLGMARRADKISLGHDASVASIKEKKAWLCVLLIGQSASELRRAAVMRVLDMRRDVAAFACANVCERRVDRHAGTVGLGRGRHDDRCLCEWNACLGQAELKGAVHARLDDGRAFFS